MDRTKIKSSIALFPIVSFILALQPSFAQKGKFELPGMNLKHPITTFDRENTYLELRNKILNNPEEFKYYNSIKTISYYRLGTEAYNSLHIFIERKN